MAPIRGPFRGYFLDYLDPWPYFSDCRWGSWRDFVIGGLNHYDRRRSLGLADGVDMLYRTRHPGYMRFLADFVERYENYDAIVLSTYNPIHPEVLQHQLKKPVKILGFVDDPISTYQRGIPYLWAFDGALYVSPSYDERKPMPEALEHWGCRHHYWLPLTQPVDISVDVREEFFVRRNRAMIYVGKPYGSKVDRLSRLKARFGGDFEVYGRWPLWGYAGVLRALRGGRPFWHRVRPITDATRRALYLDTKIGFDMHFSDRPMETGNMRMYETALHGMMLLCDKGGRNAHETIFVPDREAVFYDSIDDAIEKAEYYLAHPQERIEIAWNGFRRAHRDYSWTTNLAAFLDWVMSLTARREQEAAPSSIVPPSSVAAESRPG